MINDRGRQKLSSGSRRTERFRIPHKRLVLALVLIAVAGTAILVPVYVFHIFGVGTCGTPPANVASSAHFLVVITQAGYNDSKYHTLPWPTMNVTLRQDATIHVWNNDSIQPHGFAITHYFEQSVYLRPGESSDVVFQACQTGSFSVYETTLATNQPFLNAELDVSP
jgi:hypothetical protein